MVRDILQQYLGSGNRCPAPSIPLGLRKNTAMSTTRLGIYQLTLATSARLRSSKRPKEYLVRLRQAVKAVEESKGEVKFDRERESVLTLPTVLTLIRVVAIPVLIAVWFRRDSSSALLATVIFVAASITDFLDGYIARKLETSSAFGAFLDPVADKLMVSTVLILLSTKPLAAGPFLGNAWLVPTLSAAIIGREIAMSALREWAASVSKEAHSAVAVSQLGKWKTTTQMVSLALLLLSSRGADSAWVDAAATAGPPLLGVAAFLTVSSFAQYMRGLWPYLF